MINKKYLFLLLIIVIISCSNLDSSETPIQSTATGILEVESYPEGAQIYVDGELKESAPTTLYNIPATSHNVILRKEGFEDFQTTVIIQAGRIEEIKATLEEEIVIVTTTIPDVEIIIEETDEGILDEPKEEVITDELNQDTDIPTEETPTLQGNIEIPEFFEYIDVNKPSASTFNEVGTDLLSKNYGDYLHITAINNANILNVDKPLTAIESSDCINSQSIIGSLTSNKALCVKTSDGKLYAIGGVWDEKPDTLLVVPLD
tara:strand:+ start:3122 stop:3904 length:783 start_codon:yes stop_codon:yes gene_type:complete